jgi:hypothetical protein
MASMKYGPLHTGYKTIELPVADSQHFYHNGVNAVFLDANGHVELAVTATGTLFGIALPPAGRGESPSDDYWESSATAGVDKIAVIPVSENARFLLPADATVTAAMRGNACDLIAVNDGTATTVDVGTSSTDVFLIEGLGTDYKADAAATDVVVRINPAKVQADS